MVLIDDIPRKHGYAFSGLFRVVRPVSRDDYLNYRPLHLGLADITGSVAVLIPYRLEEPAAALAKGVAVSLSAGVMHRHNQWHLLAQHVTKASGAALLERINDWNGLGYRQAHQPVLRSLAAPSDRIGGRLAR